MYGVSHPFREVSVSNITLAPRILFHYQFLQIIVIDTFFVTEVSEYVLDRDVPVVVRIQSQESFPD